MTLTHGRHGGRDTTEERRPPPPPADTTALRCTYTYSPPPSSHSPIIVFYIIILSLRLSDFSLPNRMKTSDASDSATSITAAGSNRTAPHNVDIIKFGPQSQSIPDD
ncbi:hypothetical protein J6590_026479 [Homalodisca vitripennis]|nr:hypothetical protein J6590_026479 [Homalodisca vitripennis]